MTRSLRARMWLLLVSLGLLLLLQPAVQAGAAENAAPPVVARLDLLSTPTLGGSGQVIWAGIPNLTPDAAELSFVLFRENAVLADEVSYPLALKRGRLADAGYELRTPAEGRYTLLAVLLLSQGLQTWTDETSLTLQVSRAGVVRLEAGGFAPSGGRMQPLDQKAARIAAAGTVLSRPSVTTFRLENTVSLSGVTYALSRKVRVACAGSGSPKYYQISESSTFSGARWQSWKSAFDFTISAGNGDKTLYFKVKDAKNQESAVSRLSFRLFEATELTASGNKVSGRIDRVGESDWFFFKVSEAGSYKIETECTSLPDSLTALFEDFNNYTNPLLAGYFELRNRNRIISFYLTPGRRSPRVYFIRVQARTSSWTGAYTVRLSKRTTIKANSFSGNSSGGVVSSQNVRYSARGMGAPVQYMISESPLFDGASWQAFQSRRPSGGLHSGEFYTEFSASLSAGFGSKTLYFKVRDKDRFASNIMTWRTTWDVSRSLAVGAAAVQDQLDPSASYLPDWYGFVVNTDGDYRVEITSGIPGYVVNVSGPNAPSSSAAWRYSGSDEQAVLVCRGMRRGKYYIEVGGWSRSGGGYQAGPYTLRVVPQGGGPVVTSLRIAEGAALTVVPRVSLSANCDGSPREYVASTLPSFADASWRPLSDGVYFMLPGAAGVKTVYFKVKDAAGNISNVIQDRIDLVQPPEIALTLPPRTGIYRQNDPNHIYHGWFVFSVQTAGDYTLWTESSHAADDIGDSIMTLYAAGDPAGLNQLAYDDDSGEGLCSQITRRLAPGTYYVRVQGYNGREGRFQVGLRLGN